MAQKINLLTVQKDEDNQIRAYYILAGRTESSLVEYNAVEEKMYFVDTQGDIHNVDQDEDKQGT
jgi:hypothetical protein